MRKIEIIKTDITGLDTDVIVNAANEGLQAGGGVCGAIFRAAGYRRLQNACDEIGYCATGSTVITPAFDLQSKYVIHAVGPVWKGGSHDEEKLLYGAYTASLKLAVQYGCASIAFPLISAGIYGYPWKLAWKTAIAACYDFLDRDPDAGIRIVFAVLDGEILRLGQEALAAAGEQRSGGVAL